MATENIRLIDEIIENINKYIRKDKDYKETVEVKKGENLPKEAIKNGEKISRVRNAFQTDIGLIYRSHKSDENENKEEENKEKIYLVIIEVKGSSNITTHDILQYSSKARKHKCIYPWLRYGMVWSSPEERDIPRRFYTNNESLDFAFNFNGNVDDNFQNFYENILRKQIITSLNLHGILNGKTGTPYFSSNVDFGSMKEEDCRDNEGD